ncbi:Uncharacterised protein [Mycobacterium xenopi]|uniref:Uncharacterized protein n=1 Tax=Mycobacterium xenopi TaxID=1789 RepID=A0AAD1GWF5_MYCXE|nr:hypothetical protein MYXE_03670 [Mycobacterium xenopi]SPX79514.1 Uncharacterised protein [Mycobacterium xenopi]
MLGETLNADGVEAFALAAALHQAAGRHHEPAWSTSQVCTGSLACMCRQ